MMYHDAEFLISSARPDQWPETSYPEVIFAGRSNAGKSTLINALVNRKNLAYSGKTPGKTRLLNFYLIDKKMIFTDAPGYGYATGDHVSAPAFSRTIDPYFKYRDQLKAMVLVVDVRRVPNDDDIMMVEFAKAAHLGIIVAVTKADKLSRSQALNNMTKIANALKLNKNTMILCDSLKKNGIEEVYARIESILIPEESR